MEIPDSDDSDSTLSSPTENSDTNDEIETATSASLFAAPVLPEWYAPGHPNFQRPPSESSYNSPHPARDQKMEPAKTRTKVRPSTPPPMTTMALSPRTPRLILRTKRTNDDANERTKMDSPSKPSTSVPMFDTPRKRLIILRVNESQYITAKQSPVFNKPGLAVQPRRSSAKLTKDKTMEIYNKDTGEVIISADILKVMARSYYQFKEIEKAKAIKKAQALEEAKKIREAKQMEKAKQIKIAQDLKNAANIEKAKQIQVAKEATKAAKAEKAKAKELERIRKAGKAKEVEDAAKLDKDEQDKKLREEQESLGWKQLARVLERSVSAAKGAEASKKRSMIMLSVDHSRNDNEGIVVKKQRSGPAKKLVQGPKQRASSAMVVTRTMPLQPISPPNRSASGQVISSEAAKVKKPYVRNKEKYNEDNRNRRAVEKFVISTIRAEEENAKRDANHLRALETLTRLRHASAQPEIEEEDYEDCEDYNDASEITTKYQSSGWNCVNEPAAINNEGIPPAASTSATESYSTRTGQRILTPQDATQIKELVENGDYRFSKHEEKKIFLFLLANKSTQVLITSQRRRWEQLLTRLGFKDKHLDINTQIFLANKTKVKVTGMINPLKAAQAILPPYNTNSLEFAPWTVLWLEENWDGELTRPTDWISSEDGIVFNAFASGKSIDFKGREYEPAGYEELEEERLFVVKSPERKRSLVISNDALSGPARKKARRG